MGKLKITAGIKNFLRILLYFAAGMVLLGIGLYVLLQSSYVQTSLTGYVTRYIESAAGVKIQVGGVDFRPVRSLVLNDVLVRDFRNDTLLYCKDIRVKADSFSLLGRRFNIREVVLNEADFRIWVQQDFRKTNVEMLWDSLRQVSAPDRALSEQRNWWVGLQKISFRNSRFCYREEVYEPVDYGVNWRDIDCRDFNADITGFNFADSPVRMKVSGLSLIEKSGLVLKNMSGNVRARVDNLLITDCHFEFERSSIELLKLEYNWTPGQHDWRYFTTRMNQYYELGLSSVSFIDLAYFNGVLRGITNTVKCSGVVSNTVEHLEGHDLHFELSDKSVFQGSFTSVGLPDVWNTVFNIELHKAYLAPEDLASIYLPWFDMNIPVPAPLYKLSSTDFEQIRFTGTLSDFIVRARSVTPALSGDLSFSYGPGKNASQDYAEMKGDFNFDCINFRKFTGLSMLGNGAWQGTYAGNWGENGPSFHMNSHLRRFHVNQGNIREVSLDMTLENEQLNLLASVDDKLLGGGCALSYDMNDTLSFVSAKGQLNFYDLGALGFGVNTGTETAGAVFNLVRAGQADKSFFNLTLTDLRYTNENGAFSVDNLCIEDSRYQEHSTTILKSDIFDISIEGNFWDIRPTPFVWGLIQNYLPAYSINKKKSFRKKKVDLRKFDFEYIVRIKDADRVLKVLYPGLSISAGSQITSFFRRGDEKLTLNLLADTIRYNDIILLSPEVHMEGDPRRLKLNCSADKVVYSSGYQLFNLRNELTLEDNHLDNRLSWCNWEYSTYSGVLAASVIFRPSEKRGYTTEIKVHPGVIVMADSVWHVNPSTILLQGKELSVSDFSIRRGNEYLSVRGKISQDPQEKLLINLENFNLENLARITFKKRLTLFGIATGSLSLQDYYKDFILLTDFNVENWGLGRDTLGSLRFRSYWDAENRNLVVGAENRVGREIPLLVSGYYNPATDTINVNMKLEKVGLERLNTYTSDMFSNASGYLSGNLFVGGSARQPDISGCVYLDSVGLKVNVLNTKYFIHDSIRVDRNRLLFRDFLLKDINGHRATLNGEYQIWDSRYRLNTKFERFLVLNTGFMDNESFYGQMVLSGLAELDNVNESVNVTVNARTESNSYLYLPLTSSLTEQSNNFLHFITSGKPDVQEVQQTSGVMSEVNLNANLEVNDNLNVQVIFDPTVGDVLRTTGGGNIKIAFDKDGRLSMFGEYRISKGDYLFTLSNLVNKKFVLTPGGTINWSGSPYEAILNINAVYNLKTAITELLPVENSSDGEDQTTESGRKVPVECILNLSEKLTNPTVKFDIKFPTLATQNKSYIQSLFSSQDEINKQVFSLLVLNRFYRTDNTGDYGLQAQTAGVTTLTEMFTNQISRWFSKYSDNVDIGFAYRFGDRENEITSDELEVAVSTQLLNDRVIISANGNMDVGGNRNTTDSRKTNIAGDFDVEVKLNKQGSLKMKAYSHTDEKLLYNNTETIQGVGVSYQESFDTFRELLRKYFWFFGKKKTGERVEEKAEK